MGRVYTPEEIIKDQIPEPGAHRLAAAQILDSLFLPTMSPQPDQLFEPGGTGIESAMVYGSTAYGTAGVRSDVDLFITYRPRDLIIARETIRRTLGQAAEEFRVHIEPNVLPEGAVDNDREHGFDCLFVQHLIEIQRIHSEWCRNNPTKGLDRIALRALDPMYVTAEAHSYVSGRRNVFAKITDEVDYGIFQRALELPSAIGRKVVAATMREDDAPLDLSSRSGMYERALIALETHVADYKDPVIDKQSRLYNMDKEYSYVLDQTVHSDFKIGSYKDWVKDNYVNACELAYDVANSWVDILRPHSPKRQSISDSPSVDLLSLVKSEYYPAGSL